MGGSHPGLGTCNALVGIGPQCYIEIIGPDPEQANFQGVRPFGIDSLESAQLVNWAVRCDGLSMFVQSAKSRGVSLSDVIPMSRVTPEGETLEWALSFPLEIKQDQVSMVPFVIDWGKTPHPASRCKVRGQLVKLELEHPEPESIARVANILELEVSVSKGSKPKLIALITCPRGEVVLS